MVALAVRVNLGSPVIFHQERPGLGEKSFKLSKFRTMTDATDKEGKMLSDEERLTKFGAWLRSTSLDELPEDMPVFALETGGTDINEFKFPWILVNEDPRYVPVSTKDIINDEICILSHLNKSIDKPRYKGYGELSKEDRDYVQNFIYAGIERTSLLFLKKYFQSKKQLIFCSLGC